jgi:hypothetical protein
MLSLLQWESALKLDHELGAALLEGLKQRRLPLSSFSLGLALAMAANSQWAKKSMERVCEAYLQYFQQRFEQARGGLLTRLAPLPASALADPRPLLQKLLSASANGINLSLQQACMQLGFALLDKATAMHAGEQQDGGDAWLSPSLPSSRALPPGSALLRCGGDTLFRLLSSHPAVCGELIHQLLSRIESLGMSAAAQPHIQLLGRFIQAKETRQQMERYQQRLMSALEWLHCFSPSCGSAFIRCLTPLLRCDRALRDFAIRTCHKLMFYQQKSARLLSVDAYMALIECPYAPQTMRRAASAFQSSQPSRALTGEDTHASVDVAFFLDCSHLFRRALSYPQREVRERVYQGLLRLFEAHTQLRPYILDILHAQLRRFLLSPSEEKASMLTHKPPLRLEQALDGSKAQVVEPLAMLLASIQRMLLLEKRERGSGDSLSSQTDEGALSQLAADHRSLSQLRLILSPLLSRLCHARSLQELGVRESHLSGPVSDPLAVAAVLQVQVLHDVLACMLEWQVTEAAEEGEEERKTGMETETHSAASSPPPSSAPAPVRPLPFFSPAACSQFVHLFDLFWQLHSLLTQNAHRPKDAQAQKSKAKPQKKGRKKKSADAEEEEDEEESAEEEDSGDSAEEEDASVGKAGRGSKRAAPKSKAAGRAKPPAQAISALCRHGAWKRYILQPSTLLQLLRMSQPGSGPALAEDLAASASASASPHRPQLHLRAHGSASSAASPSPDSSAVRTVGDVLHAHLNLQRWLTSHLSEFVQSWLDSGAASSSQREEGMLRLCQLAPYLNTMEKNAHKECKQRAEQQEEQGKKKGKKEESTLRQLHVRKNRNTLEIQHAARLLARFICGLFRSFPLSSSCFSFSFFLCAPLLL